MKRIINQDLNLQEKENKRLDAEIIEITIFHHIHKIVEKHFVRSESDYSNLDLEALKTELERYLQICGIEEYDKEIIFSYNKENKTMTIDATVRITDNLKEINLEYNITELKQQFEDKYTHLGKRIFDEDNNLRFKGKLITTIKERLNGKEIDREEINIKYDSEVYGLKIFYIGEIKDGVPHGEGKLLWEDGKILYKGEFTEGKVTGYGESYFLSGGVSEVGYRIDGVLSGETTFFTENGQIRFKGNYRDGIPYGNCITYSEDGSTEYTMEISSEGPITNFSKKLQ